MSNKIKTYAANIILKPHETLTIKFPYRYFNKKPTVTTTAHIDTAPFIKNVTKDYFVITNNTHRRVRYSYVACLTFSKQIRVKDSDGDSLLDDEEVQIGTDPLNSDTDSDGLSDADEVNTYSTDPLDIDTDSDNFNDGIEIAFGSDPLDPDSDDDGITDGDEINIYATSPMTSDTDFDGFTDLEEINAGSNPVDPNSIPVSQETSTLYFALTTENNFYAEKDFIAIYTGEMSSLEYPQITNLQPDANANTHYELITSDEVSDKHNFDPYRIYNLNSDDYNNTAPPSAIFKIDNINKNQTYKIFALNDNSPSNQNDPNTSLNIIMSSSNNDNENNNTILSSNTSANLFNYDSNEEQYLKYYWIHDFSIDSNNDITLNTTNNQQEASFYDGASAYLMFHTNYTQNSNSTDPDVEIAIQSANYDFDADISNYAGYISQFEYVIQDIQNQDDAFSLLSNLNYSAITTNLNLDTNSNNQARFNAQTSARQRYRIHVKVGQGTDCNFNISIKPIGMMDYFMNYNQSIDDYNTNYNSSSSVSYINLIPSDGNLNQRIYYYYFTVREDGFIVWENN